MGCVWCKRKPHPSKMAQWLYCCLQLVEGLLLTLGTCTVWLLHLVCVCASVLAATCTCTCIWFVCSKCIIILWFLVASLEICIVWISPKTFYLGDMDLFACHSDQWLDSLLTRKKQKQKNGSWHGYKCHCIWTASQKWWIPKIEQLSLFWLLGLLPFN